MVDLVKHLQDAEEMLQRCQDELENAQSMRNVRQIAQYKRWVTEAKHHRDQAKQALADAQGPLWIVKPT